jgi:pyruvate dehydrogenase E2 component (dihydrolipoamide acetyltransferase)
MATDVIMPALGVAQQTGTLLKWLKSEGQSVTKGEPLMEVETDKATVEIEAAASGVLANVIAEPGEAIPVGQKIAVIVAPGETLVKEQRVSRAAVHESFLPEGEGRAAGRAATASPKPQAQPTSSTTAAAHRLLASPAAKRLAREKGIALMALRGSGPEGSILAQDVLRAAQARNTAEPPVSPTATAGLRQLSPMRRIVGERMTQSKQSAPHFYLSMDIDMTGALTLRARLKERDDASTPSINDFILQACAHALKDFPALNSTFSQQGIQVHEDINIGMAVALDEGLVVPVIRDADRLSLTELAAKSRELTDKAQSKKLFPLDYEGGTFTVSNLGMLDVDRFIAIINPPQCAILAVGRVAPRVVTDGDGIEIKSMMTATLSADHRIVDGAIAARFLKAVKQQLESTAASDLYEARGR